MTRHLKKSRIYLFGKYLKYPFELQNLLRAMPLNDSLMAALSFGWNLLARRFREPTLVSYKDWFVHLYGQRLYRVMCHPYTSKIWHTDPAHISADWADQRFQGESLKRLLKRVVTKLLTLDFSSYNLEDDSLAPDGGPFYYPDRGIQEMPDALARSAVGSAAAAMIGQSFACAIRISIIDPPAGSAPVSTVNPTGMASSAGMLRGAVTRPRPSRDAKLNTDG